jgi:hypothetical protein
MKPITKPEGEKQKNYTERQESERKDVERGFAGLQVSISFFLLMAKMNCLILPF